MVPKQLNKKWKNKEDKRTRKFVLDNPPVSKPKARVAMTKAP